MKNWEKRAYELLEKSLTGLPHELNELDWKVNLSPNYERLSCHLSAFANHPGGGFLIFGIDNKDRCPIGRASMLNIYPIGDSSHCTYWEHRANRCEKWDSEILKAGTWPCMDLMESIDCCCELYR